MGLIGYGNIGKKVAEFAEVLKMKVQYANSQTSNGEVDDIIASSDILSLHAPLTGSTKHIIDERRLKLMKKGSYLINTARGAEIDQKALINALESGMLAGAALDVFENEPMRGNPSEEIIKLSNMENVIATPHIGFNTEETYVRMGEEIIEGIKSCISESPIHVLN